MHAVNLRDSAHSRNQVYIMEPRIGRPVVDLAPLIYMTAACSRENERRHHCSAIGFIPLIFACSEHLLILVSETADSYLVSKRFVRVGGASISSVLMEQI